MIKFTREDFSKILKHHVRRDEFQQMADAANQILAEKLNAMLAKEQPSLEIEEVDLSPFMAQCFDEKKNG